jgi:hypothetical protein
MEGVAQDKATEENERNREMEILYFVLKFYITLTYPGTSRSGGKVWPHLVM